MRPIRLAYLVTHPIQYQAPLLRRIAADADIELEVFFSSDFSTRPFADDGFGRTIAWDVPLTEGYRHQVLPALDPGHMPDFWRPWSYGLGRRLDEGRFDALWIHGYARLFHWRAMLAAKRRGLKVLLRDEATPISAQRSGAKQRAKRAFFALVDRLVDAYLAIGTLNRRYYMEHGVAAAKIHPMPYAVDNGFFRDRVAAARPARETLRARLGLAPGRPVILFASKMIERKRAADLIEAQAVLARGQSAAPYLLMAGDGPLRADLEARAQALRLADVHVLGFQGQEALPALFDLCDLFVLPSVLEPWGLVVNEAMNAGRPVVVSDQTGCAPDLVRDGENGHVVPAGDTAALARALGRITGDAALAARMGARSLEIVGAWDFEADVAGLKSALRHCLGGRDG